MPGGRLTQQDRRDIAAGLAKGLGYAEIARRLSRPTSTVSREVSRNGGPGAYRAERAHQATERRARRRKQPPRSAPPSADTAYGRDPEELREFTERLVETLVQTGVQRMASRVLACLYTTDTGTLAAKELAQRLQVSPASISTAVAYLEEQELIRRERDPRRRRELYSVDNALWYRSFLASAQRNFSLAETARDGARVLGPTTPAGARCEFVGEFLRLTGEDILRTAERWRHLLVPQTRDNPE
ncbi:GbsR/MarR family transcriptional regulator [Nonomuraea jabiensis]|uniref:DNA-binding transcriptional ArsR family regulator n=1 Tax=Nonomuraea jabiensis TaxID=882448 RepID=A0A7W9L8C9_9ACTN|nr:helix-turn-helix domain-containing protein [Nonomuraea jabiensis]MBB5774358.1 DNA-binding transcriptional ArsR family regulator [Nonomuraea jabiensis]